ncbi:Ark- serine/threonine protein kinase [Ophidiomyces ophidiicola]|uniref:Ark- serine/threonine protein kinase n=1 Tax=Ophidiomyces ophidiicola TaxID=1387563 RepID=A0ACB8V1S2_9EURO|nr:Ark- serine/threonine protein kinase [Ophidiomyces ophidiicola]KAI1936965.1 Ark- serine/threonine protein kinase [Ophidiomyces ophidiicola]KAI1949831.1 Ark- serine/threonine protein kinase [Ophidiomyces ophidiicola]KAI1952115.1 Ark- serine/threonine protein kinase [Ophidiomyces ophidiicola]KAI1971932.1 Ark- serine/threonine protein kinase [Ophidiomyces ophidiicola]KAI2019036.1 Ark- serine/threonine protein kinase [Ophidiomyces ophidiicola]
MTSAAVVPAGTFIPGTKVQVGNHRVVIEKYLSEGGFAHVYVVRLPQPVDGSDTAVLKRVAVPDKAALANMRTEVETMKKLKGHRHIVTYIDSHASQLKGGGYEVFLLMEFCAGGGLIDFMNTRLQNRLTEPEILKIFTDVAEGVACMHYLKPPLLHRDLKVENVLISLNGSSYRYKLCDFGSSAPPRPPATSAAEGRLIEDDVQRHTTLQYRSPEMIDVYRKQPIDEKSDIWALGVLLYKLCYYTTPFEEVGQMAILNASFKYPAYPHFSDRLKLLIATMLKENPQDRPNVYQVLREACHMGGKEVPIRDIYAGRTQSEARQYQKLPITAETPKIGAIFSPPIQETQIIPEIAPMRRGRPVKPISTQHSAKPSPSPLRTPAQDPFAALDGGTKKTNADELSSRFPTLDQFSLIHEKSGKFEFEPTVAADTNAPTEDLSKRITNALADDAFVKPPTAPPQRSPALGGQPTKVSRKFTEENMTQTNIRLEPLPPIYQPKPQKPVMISTGTMTSPSPPPPPVDNVTLPAKPSHRLSETPQIKRQSWDHGLNLLGKSRDILGRRSSRNLSSDDLPKSPASSRPSLEGPRPSATDLNDPLATRSKSANAKSRPSSAYFGSRIENLRDQEPSPSLYGSNSRQESNDSGELLRPVRSDTDRKISSDVDYLRAKEEEEQSRKQEKRSSTGSKHVKRSSLSSLSLSGTKTLFAGRFGDAFRRFENNGTHDPKGLSQEERYADLSPITGSEIADMSDDGPSAEEDHLSPETRRELERRRLSQEEKRVANAAAEYRQRVIEKGGLGGSAEGPKSSVIQNKVESLLKENVKPSTKTASGYGKYTDAEAALQAKQFEGPVERATPNVIRRPPTSNQEFVPRPSSKDIQSSSGFKHAPEPPHVQLPIRPGPRPVAPPKPKSLRSTGESPTDAVSEGRFPIDRKPSNTKEDWEISFSRRYPSLSGLELVETEIDLPTPTTASHKVQLMRTKEV